MVHGVQKYPAPEQVANRPEGPVGVPDLAIQIGIIQSRDSRDGLIVDDLKSRRQVFHAPRPIDVWRFHREGELTLRDRGRQVRFEFREMPRQLAK